MNDAEVKLISDAGKLIRGNIEKIIVGKSALIELVMVSILCEGHILLEDVPGIGKTMLARSIARSLKCQFRRIQCTPDLLPSDITGTYIYNQKNGEFEYRPGPILLKSF
jgi:MoxR-like ATPase